MSKVKGCLLFSIIGFLAVLCTTSVQTLTETGNIVWTLPFTGKLLIISLLAGTAGGSLLYYAFCAAARLMEKRAVRLNRRWNRPIVHRKRFFLLTWLAMFLCWFPAYLAYYPAICSYDMTIQLGQITEHAYNDHHPIFHTLLIQGFMELGRWLGNVNTGIGLYALTQMLLLAGAMAFCLFLLSGCGVKKSWLGGLLIYGCVFPFHMYMSISVTKDTIFSAFLLVQLVVLAVLLRRGRNSLKPAALDGCYVASGLGVVLFRSNGRYAMLVAVVFLATALLFGRKYRKLYGRILIQTMGVLVLGIMLLSGIFKMTDAEQGDRREMLSVPIQQLARTYVYHGGAGVVPEDDDTMSAEDKALINDFILNEAYQDYRPDIADPVKRNTNTYVARYRMKEFLSTYVGLFLQYPGDYVNAVLATNAGYLSPGDTSHAVINVNGRDRGLGYIQTRWVENELNPAGIYKDSKWEWLHEKLETFADSNGYLNIPVLKYLMVPGSYLWLYLILAAWLLVNRRYRQLLPLSLVMGYYLTLLLGPTVQLRYLYPLMIALPFLAVLCCNGIGSCNGMGARNKPNER
ncbi:MAG: hypothetical protein IJZ34_09540 [Lachnospiraceae bacterium]|nr:hypothetical protein [Lachnospiraceae bacterium]